MIATNQHVLKIQKQQYPRGLRFIECEQCTYFLAVEIDERKVIRSGSEEVINEGDKEADHSYAPSREW